MENPFDQTDLCKLVLVHSRALVGVSRRFLAGEATFLRRLRVGHICTVNTKYATTVYCSLESTQCAID